jgi:hypothetical protein
MLRQSVFILLAGVLCATPLLAQIDVAPEPITVTTASDRDEGDSLQGWLASDRANDLNLDGVVDGADYDMRSSVGGDDDIIVISPAPEPIAADPDDVRYDPDAWLASERATDLDDDGIIDYTDFRIWAAGLEPVIAPEPIRLPSAADEYVRWEYAADMNRDGVLDSADFDLWIQRANTPEPGIDPKEGTSLSFEDYLSIYNTDLNDDGVVDRADFQIWQTNPFLGVLPRDNDGMAYAQWLSTYALDMNGDDVIDEADYQEFQANPVVIMPTAVQSASWGAIKRGLER